MSKRYFKKIDNWEQIAVIVLPLILLFEFILRHLLSLIPLPVYTSLMWFRIISPLSLANFISNNVQGGIYYLLFNDGDYMGKTLILILFSLTIILQLALIIGLFLKSRIALVALVLGIVLAVLKVYGFVDIDGGKFFMGLLNPYIFVLLIESFIIIKTRHLYR